MTKYITKAAQDRLLKTIPVKYHHNPQCTFITRGGSEPLLLSEQDQVDFMKLLKPCSLCFPGEKPQELPPTKFPYAHEVIIWTCSDGVEFSKETDALWHELEITKTRRGR